MLKATSTVALKTPANGMPVPLPDRMVGFTMTMYDIVTNVVTPPTTSGFNRFNRFRRFGGFRSVGSRTRPSEPIEATEGLNPGSDAVSAEARGEDGLEVGFRARAGQIEIRFAERVDQGANHVRAADRDAAGRTDVRAETRSEE